MTNPTAPKPMRPAVSTKRTIAISAATAALVYAAITPFTGRWEGTDLVAKRDMIGTGHPMTYCHGQTDEFGKVRAGQRFTPAQCDDLLEQSLPKYLAPLQRCITREAPVKVIAAALDAAYNAGPAAVCRSPMVARINAGNFTAACNSFAGWYISASGRVVQGLINRRNAEKKFCLEGVREGLPPAPVPTVKPWWQRLAQLATFWKTA